MPRKTLAGRRLAAAVAVAAALAAAIPLTGTVAGSAGTVLAMEGGGVGP